MLISLTLGAILGASAAPSLLGEEVVHRRLATMGTEVQVEILAPDRQTALEGSERAVAAIERCSARLSTWGVDSELARLNSAAPSAEIRLSAELGAELLAARRWSRATAGAFDPCCGALLDAWDVRGVGRRPSAAELESALTASGMDGLDLQVAPTTGAVVAVRRRPGLRIEEGGFGKGAGLDAALAALAETDVRAATLNLGGQVAWFGQAPRTLDVAHPDRRERVAVTLDLSNADFRATSAATSGNSELAHLVDGVPIGHILDPRHGRPAADFGSVTVIAGDALAADALSTAFFVLGPEGALAAAAALDGIEVLVLERRDTAEPNDLRVRFSEGLSGHVARVPHSPLPAPSTRPTHLR